MGREDLDLKAKSLEKEPYCPDCWPQKERGSHTSWRVSFQEQNMGGASGKELACQCRRRKRCGFDPWVRKIPWRRK